MAVAVVVDTFDGMNRRLANVGRATTVLVVCTLAAHFVTGMAVHLLAAPSGVGQSIARGVTSSAPAHNTLLGCGDGGSCRVTDRPAEGIVIATLSVVFLLLVATRVDKLLSGRAARGRHGPAPPPHLSSQVVLLI